MTRKLICAMMALCFIALLPLLHHDAQADSAAVQARLDYMLQVYPSGSYFSQNGQACTGGQHSGCSNCQLFNVPARGGLPAGNAVGADASATCVGFAKYAFYCLNNTVWAAQSNTNVTAYTGIPYNQVYQKAKLGDYISYPGHAGIFIRGDSSGYYMYEANVTITNQVKYCSFKHTDGPCKIVHANNYSETKDVEWATITADQTSVPVGTQVNFTVASNVAQGENGYYYDVYVWDSASYPSGEGIWVGVSANAASYTFNTAGDYYVRFRVHNPTHDLYSDPISIHVFAQSVSLKISSGTTGSGHIVQVGGQVNFEFITGYVPGENGCYFDMYVWDSASYSSGGTGTWVGVNGKYSSYVFSNSGEYYVRARVHNSTMDIYSEPVVIRVPTIPDDDFYAVILNTASWKPLSQVEGSTGICMKTEDNSARQIWRFQKQSNGAYSISSCYDGKMLEMTNGVRENGTQITAHDIFWGGAYQQWYLIPYGGGYLIYSTHYAGESWVLDVRNGDTSDGNAIQIYQQNGTAAQIWSIYAGDEVQLKGQTLEVDTGSSLAPTLFSWNKTYGANFYNLRIFKDVLYDGEDFSQWEISGPCSVWLPAGHYYAYVDSINYHRMEKGPTVEFTVPEAFNILYQCNDGRGLFDARIKLRDEALVLYDQAGDRPGYEFTGWNTAPDGSGKSYAPGDSYLDNADVTLYAQWRPFSMLVLPSDIAWIDEEAFAGSGVAVVRVPNGCVSIGARAFSDCAQLVEVFIPGSVTMIDESAFDGSDHVAILGSADSYACDFALSQGIEFREYTE